MIRTHLITLGCTVFERATLVRKCQIFADSSVQFSSGQAQPAGRLNPSPDKDTQPPSQEAFAGRFVSYIQRNCNEALAGLANPESLICNDTVWTFLPCLPQKSFASRYMSAFGPSAGPNPTCALRLDTVYVSPSIGTTPLLEHAVVKQARTSLAVQVFFIVLFSGRSATSVGFRYADSLRP